MLLEVQQDLNSVDLEWLNEEYGQRLVARPASGSPVWADILAWCS